MTFDTVVRNARWFDGTGGPSAFRDIGITDGRVAAIGVGLDTAGCPDVIDADGQWVLPGMIDIHTHYDIEVLGSPGLGESVRHGVTTVLVGSCSLSTVHVESEEAGDIFGRVEAIPRAHVIGTLDAKRAWSSAREYAAALDELPLGPNVAAFIGHSDIRTAVLGLDRATHKQTRPTDHQLATMERMLTEALDAGFVGMSVQELLFDKVDGELCRSRTLPSTYARRAERRRLTAVLRRRRRVLQGGPDISNPANFVRLALSSAGRGGALKVSLLAAADVKSNPLAVRVYEPLGRLVKRLGGDLKFQHLPVPFEVYADGIDLVIFEEFGSGAAALHLTDAIARDTMLRSEDYRGWFRKDYDTRFGPRVWQRDFHDADIVGCPDETLVGKSFGQVGDERGVHPVDAFLDLVLEHGTALRWRTTISNHRPEKLRKLAVSPYTQIGFSDAGAHLRNMSFYNFGLRLLKHVRDAERSGRPFMTVEQAVHRLTGELGEWYGLDAGTLRVGDRADLVIIDPAGLDATLEGYAEEAVPLYGGLRRMVNRNDAAVPAVFVNGRRLVESGLPTKDLGTLRAGRFLRAGEVSRGTHVALTS